jgi:hypothetical protein
MHDFDSFIYKVKRGEIILPKKISALQFETDDSWNEYEVSLKQEMIMDENIQNVFSNHSKYCPVMFIGKYAKVFLEHYENRVNNKVFIMKSLVDVEWLIEDYSGVREYSCGYFVIEVVQGLNENAQKRLCDFVGQSKIPVVLLSNSSIELSLLKRKMNYIFK